MLTAVWSVKAWPEVYATVEQFAAAARQLKPISQQYEKAAGILRSGNVLWSTLVQGRPVGLAWDWAELRPQVVAICDPMCILTNVKLVDAEGCLLEEGSEAMELNRVIHDLPWQQAVLRGEGCSQLLAA
jgi:hypothetical protein